MSKSVQSVDEAPTSWENGRVFASLTLLEWGALLVYFYFSGRIASLLHPSFHLLVLVTGMLLGASGCLLWWREEMDVPSDACTAGCCEHSLSGFSAGRLLSFLVLTVPIALAAVISPDSYGSVMVRNRGVFETVEKASSGTTPIPDRAAVPPETSQNEAPTTVEIGDLLMAAQTKSGMAQYDGKRVELIGQVFPLGERKFDLVRMLMLCCAADAQMLTVRVVSDHDLQLPAMKWAKATGRVGFIKKGDHGSPALTVEEIVPVQRPADPYVYRGGSLQSAAPRENFKMPLPPR